jgi:hypothetical protein
VKRRQLFGAVASLGLAPAAPIVIPGMGGSRKLVYDLSVVGGDNLRRLAEVLEQRFKEQADRITLVTESGTMAPKEEG